MTDKQVFAAIVGGILSAIGGGQLIIPIQLIYESTGRHLDGGDDGWGFLWIALSIPSGIIGLVFSAKWARKRFPATVLQHGSSDFDPAISCVARQTKRTPIEIGVLMFTPIFARLRLWRAPRLLWRRQCRQRRYVRITVGPIDRRGRRLEFEPL